MRLRPCVILKIIVAGVVVWPSFLHAEGPGPAGAAALPGVADAQWDLAFTRTDGWTGADAAGTIDLGDGRTLWLFGDTWIGKVVQGGHAPGSHMVNNSIALQDADSAPSKGTVPFSLRSRTIATRKLGQSPKAGEPPAASEMHFHWGAGDARDRPTAWIAPDSASMPAGGKTSDPEHPLGWYWATGGGALVPGPGGEPRAIVFLFHVGKAEGKTGVWAFKSLGSALATIDGLDRPVDRWQVRQYQIPATGPGADGQRKETHWGMAACRPAAEPGTVYIYGTRDQSPLNRQLLLARVAADAVPQFDAWRFYAGHGKWSNRANEAVAVAENLVSELSVEEYADRGKAVFIMVHSEPIFGPRVMVRTAARPEGPWTQPLPVYVVPELQRNRLYFTYAAKGHLSLSRPGELLITYLVNAHDFGAAARDAAIYRPRFIRVPLARILP
ncbi:MAG: DUF4185 domain-containing protein [Thermoguttaceae bacterium]|jgi:hypothetical protein